MLKNREPVSAKMNLRPNLRRGLHFHTIDCRSIGTIYYFGEHLFTDTARDNRGDGIVSTIPYLPRFEPGVILLFPTKSSQQLVFIYCY